MKRWIAFLGGFLCYMACVLSVHADVIFEPKDSFYEEFSSECEYIGRTFTANGPDGEVILYKSPASDRVIARWENGFKAYISFSYTDDNGVVWGIYEDLSGSQTGWMPMEYMDVVYDSISFREEYQSEFTAQEGTLDEQYLGKDIYFWKYPGASEGYRIQPSNDMPRYHSTYVDSQGHTWGNVSYYFGHKNVWICLDQPGAEFDTLYSGGSSGIGEARLPEKNFTADRIVPSGSADNLVMPVTVAALLAALATGGLLFLKRKKH